MRGGGFERALEDSDEMSRALEMVERKMVKRRISSSRLSKLDRLIATHAEAVHANCDEG